ncbi:hypothetical protein EJC50_02005 [Paenibacillus albus]|uniref:Oligosaccharide repeat unit polymerase n=2 Tax=Paenibacillus albus TaxID=2495582 RepID=A0A3S8ZYL7_9BACL|nr:hypothetical protein EJC50_02005 [Paenibacillus albus]
MLFYAQPIVYFITGEEYSYDFSSIKTLVIITVLGIHFFILGNLVFNTKKLISINVEIPQRQINQAINFSILITLLCIMLLFVDAKTFNVLNLGRLDLKNAGSLLRITATFGLYLTSVLFFLVYFTAKKRSRFNIILWTIFVIVLEIIIFLFYRTRSLLVVHLASCLVGYYYSYAYFSSEIKIKTKKGKALLFGVIIVCIAIFTRFFRGYLQPGSDISTFEINWKSFLQKSVEDGDLGYSSTVLKVINLVPNTYDYLNGQSYWKLLLTPIPRSIWSEKPLNTETIVGGWLFPEIRGMSVPPGIIGDLYLNFGVYGVLLMIVFGIGFSLLDRKVTFKGFLIWAVSSTWIFHLVRGGFTNPIMIFFIQYYFINFIIKRYFLGVIIHNSSQKLLRGRLKGVSTLRLEADSQINKMGGT